MMKKMVMLVAALSTLLLLSVTASAHDRDDSYYGDDGRFYHHHRYADDRNWHRTHRDDYDSEGRLPFRWYARYDSMREHYRLERIYDREWNDRFAGYRAYRWHGDEGFWHHGHYVTDAVFFYDEDDRLISVGYIADGVFIHFREDHSSYENHDSFFFSWWSR